MKRISRREIDQSDLRERILFFGPMGTGKTTAIASLMKSFPDSDIYLIDTDAGYEKIFRELYPDVKNFEIFECDSMSDVMEALEEIEGVAKPNDWVCIDKLDDIWEFSQNAWSEAMTGEPHIMEHLMKKQKTEGARLKEQGKRAPIFAMDQLEVWPAINFIHNYRFADILKRGKFNVMGVAGIRDKTEGLDDEMASIFRGIKFMPGGQKHNTHRYDTVIMAEVDVTKEIPAYTMTSLKDRGNRKLYKSKRWTVKEGFWEGYKKYAIERE